MNHIVSRVFVTTLLLCGLLSVWSCAESGADIDTEDLAVPTDVKIIELTDHSVTIEWQAVKRATQYRWDCDSADQDIGGCCPGPHLSIDLLKPGSSYHFRVRAEDMTRSHPADGGPYPLFSDWTELDFTTPKINE